MMRNSYEFYTEVYHIMSVTLEHRIIDCVTETRGNTWVRELSFTLDVPTDLVWCALKSI